MILNAVSKSDMGYSFYYTRVFNDFDEVYTNNFVSETVQQTDTDILIDLWRLEFVYIETQNGQVVNVKWNNPSMITNVDN